MVLNQLTRTPVGGSSKRLNLRTGSLERILIPTMECHGSRGTLERASRLWWSRYSITSEAPPRNFSLRHTSSTVVATIPFKNLLQGCYELRPILYQLLDQCPSLCDLFLPIFLYKQRKHGKDISWHFGELKSFLLSSVGMLGPNPLLLLVESFDECMDEEAQLVVTFLESLACSTIKSENRLKVCLASWSYPQIRMIKKIGETLQRIQNTPQIIHTNPIKSSVSNSSTNQSKTSCSQWKGFSRSIHHWINTSLEIAIAA